MDDSRGYGLNGCDRNLFLAKASFGQRRNDGNENSTREHPDRFSSRFWFL